jgi:hypothetical protein
MVKYITILAICITTIFAIGSKGIIDEAKSTTIVMGETSSSDRTRINILAKNGFYDGNISMAKIDTNLVIEIKQPKAVPNILRINRDSKEIYSKKKSCGITESLKFVIKKDILKVDDKIIIEDRNEEMVVNIKVIK